MRLSTTAAAEEPSLLTLEERLAVVNLYEELGSYRAVAAIVGCDHKTVKAMSSGANVARLLRGWFELAPPTRTDTSSVSVSSRPRVGFADAAC